MGFPVPTVGYALLLGLSVFTLGYAARLNDGASDWSASAAERIQSERRLRVVKESMAKALPSVDKWLSPEKSAATLSKASASAVVLSKTSALKPAASQVAVDGVMPAPKPGEAPTMPSSPSGASTLRFEATKAN